MLVDPDSFTIDRKYWSYGLGSATKLLDDTDKKDCIGFLLLASGIKSEELLNLDEPIDVLKKHEWITKLIEWSGSSYSQSSVCYDIVKTNDTPGIEQSVREQKLIELFGSIGIVLKFEN